MVYTMAIAKNKQEATPMHEPTDKAIPAGYMTVGQLAKKVRSTVRTLQYYDKEGLLSPSAVSEGGFRLYTDKDMVKFMQIYTLKQLGLTLGQIKQQLPSLDHPKDVAALLAQQAADIQAQIEKLTQSLADIQNLQQEVIYLNTVDFKKYAAILITLQMKNENYWAVKFFDNETIDYITDRFSGDKAQAARIGEEMNKLNDQALAYATQGVSPHSPEAQVFATKYWDTIMDFTGGNQQLITKLATLADQLKSQGDQQGADFLQAHEFIGHALEAYFIKQGEDPFAAYEKMRENKEATK